MRNEPSDFQKLSAGLNPQGFRYKLASQLESKGIQSLIVALILINSLVMGLETSPSLMAEYGPLLKGLDKACLALFGLELVLKLTAYRLAFFKSPWNVFDMSVVLIAVSPASGPWAVLRTLRVLRVLRLLTIIPSLRKVIAAFLMSIPGLAGVASVMLIFFYTAGVLATNVFGAQFPEWFGSLGKSLYTLFQVMTLESWSMGIVRPVMEVQPWAWMFFVPFIVIATFTILNLFIGIIVSTMQELSIPEDQAQKEEDLKAVLKRLDLQLTEVKNELRSLRGREASVPASRPSKPTVPKAGPETEPSL